MRKQEGKHDQIKNYYQALTVIELGLLRLNEKFGGNIISESIETNHYNLPQELMTLAGCFKKET